MDRRIRFSHCEIVKGARSQASQLLGFILWLERQGKEYLIKDFQMPSGQRPYGVVLSKIVVVSWWSLSSGESHYKAMYGTCKPLPEKLCPRSFDSFEELIETLTKEGHL